MKHMNPFALSRRRAKVSALLEVIDLSEQYPTAEQVAAWPDALWVATTEIANRLLTDDEKPFGVPSLESRADVVARLLEREMGRAS